MAVAFSVDIDVSLIITAGCQCALLYTDGKHGVCGVFRVANADLPWRLIGMRLPAPQYRRPDRSVHVQPPVTDTQLRLGLRHILCRYRQNLVPYPLRKSLIRALASAVFPCLFAVASWRYPFQPVGVVLKNPTLGARYLR